MSKREIVIVALLIGVSFSDAFRDTMRGRLDYWPYHIIKWVAFYPPLIWIWWEEVKGRNEKVVVIIACWLAWSLAAWATRPPHWGPMAWGWSVFSF